MNVGYTLIAGDARGTLIWTGPRGLLVQATLPPEIFKWLNEHETLARLKPTRPSYRHAWIDGEWHRT